MLRRLAYLFVALAFLLVMSLPIFAFVLAARGELMVGDADASYARLFMVNTDREEGIGLQRVTRAGSGDNCLQGSVRYLLWQGQGDELEADYCTCFDSQAGTLTLPGRCQGE